MKRAAANIEQARKKIYRYCAYQERSHEEVRNKLFSLGLSAQQVDTLLAELIAQNFLNEERFARAFAGGKFRLKKWGRLKIIRELEARAITPTCISLALQEIDLADYRKTLRMLIEKNMAALQAKITNPYQLRHRLSRQLIQKGYEPELVWEEIRAVLPD
jgi:regulatory protein